MHVSPWLVSVPHVSLVGPWDLSSAVTATWAGRTTGMNYIDVVSILPFWLEIILGSMGINLQ